MTGNTIFVNGRFLTKPVTGVQRYSLELMRHIDLILAQGSLSQAVQFVCLIPAGKFKHPGWKNIEIRQVGLNKGNLWEQVDLPFYARGQLLFSPGNIGPYHYRNQVVTFHDASVFAVPGAYSRAFRAKYIFIFRQLLQNARLIFTVSRFSQQELARYLKVSPERFKVVVSGSDHLDHVQPDAQILEKLSLEQYSYLLVMAGQYSHKNLDAVFEALKLLKTEIEIVVIGAGFKPDFQGKHAQSSSANVRFPGYVSDEELKALYQNALGFIFPSIYEGFGLPVLEAMRCGCPVICSNAASLPEVAGDAALYFDPYKIEHIAAVLDHFLSTPELHEQLRVKGYRQAARFEWATTAQQICKNLIDALKPEIPRRLPGPSRETPKRLLDLVLILAASPLIILTLALIALAIKLDSPGPVFYSQRRIGRYGKEIDIWKFRSMAVNADEILQAFLNRSPSLKREWEQNYKLKNDPRITRFGNILRRTSLDELPQIWNVLCGEMSLIGPRPIVEEEIPLYGKELEIYKQVLPGLTGLWQISGRNDLPYHERVRLDIYYIQNWSIWLDISILLRTLPIIVDGSGAY